jgi:hypothetical protein
VDGGATRGRRAHGLIRVIRASRGGVDSGRMVAEPTASSATAWTAALCMVVEPAAAFATAWTAALRMVVEPAASAARQPRGKLVA